MAQFLTTNADALKGLYRKGLLWIVGASVGLLAYFGSTLTEVRASSQPDMDLERLSQAGIFFAALFFVSSIAVAWMGSPFGRYPKLAGILHSLAGISALALVVITYFHLLLAFAFVRRSPRGSSASYVLMALGVWGAVLAPVLLALYQGVMGGRMAWGRRPLPSV